jgi:hypothetical protein
MSIARRYPATACLLLAAFTVLLPQPGAAVCHLLHEDFEDATHEWTTTGLWHGAQPSQCLVPAPSAKAMYFGDDVTCAYDVGVAVEGELVSPPINAVEADSTLIFDLLRQVEPESSDTFDQTEVAIRTVGSNDWTTVWSRDSTVPSLGEWTTSEPISLTTWTGKTIEVRFRFTSGDEEDNGFLGWIVDEVRVTRPCDVTSRPPSPSSI